MKGDCSGDPKVDAGICEISLSGAAGDILIQFASPSSSDHEHDHGVDDDNHTIGRQRATILCCQASVHYEDPTERLRVNRMLCHEEVDSDRDPTHRLDSVSAAVSVPDDTENAR